MSERWLRSSMAPLPMNVTATGTWSPRANARSSAAAFRRLIDHGLRYGGSYFLTYHRWAARGQVEAAYPRFTQFLRLKRQYDPSERFQSDWYRHYRALFAA